MIEKTGASPVPPAEQVQARVATTLAAFAAVLGETALPPVA